MTFVTGRTSLGPCLHSCDRPQELAGSRQWRFLLLRACWRGGIGLALQEWSTSAGRSRVPDNGSPGNSPQPLLTLDKLWKEKQTEFIGLNCLTNWHLFLGGRKEKWVNMPNSFETKGLLPFWQSCMIVSWFPPGSKLLRPVSPKPTYSAVWKWRRLLDKLHPLALLSLRWAWTCSEVPLFISLSG